MLQNLDLRFGRLQCMSTEIRLRPK